MATRTGSVEVTREVLLTGLRGQSNRRFSVRLGSCAVCGLSGRSRTVYRELDSWSRDHLTCLRCRAVPRERCLALAIERVRPDWRRLTIHESSPSPRGFSLALERECRDYSCSQYLEGETPGAMVDGVRNEDLGDLTFDDDSLDLLITQDVFEHVMHPDLAFAEIRRVLRPGGLHMATFPWNPDLAKTRRRAIEEKGEVVHLLDPEWHGNPIGDGRSLVTIDWGADVFTIAADNGFDLVAVKVPHYRKHGIDGEHREVFVFTAT